MKNYSYSRRKWLYTMTGCLSVVCSTTWAEAVTAAKVPVLSQDKLLNNNFQIVDLTDLEGDLPLDIVSTRQVLKQTEDWEHSTWKNTNWPHGGGDSVGYPSVVKNTEGINPDGKYYLYYAHHDPRSGIGVAVAESLTGPYLKNVKIPGRSDNQVVPSFHADSQDPDDPSHTSSPWVVWNQQKNIWCMYFHFFNHAHGRSTNYQPTGMATTSDLASHQWSIVRDESAGTVPPFLPVLPTTSKLWANEASSYNTVHRLPDGRWLAFVRGTANDGQPTRLGFAFSDDGQQFDYLEQNPILHAEDDGNGRKGVYRPGFIGYLGKNSLGENEYLLAWQESQPFDSDPRLIYGYTTDFHKIRRDERGYVPWKGNDGAVSAWREGNRLYLFAGKFLHEMKLPVRKKK